MTSTQAGGGAIAVRVGSLLDVRESELTTTVQGGGGDAGNITLEAPSIIANHSRITANAFGGMGGNIRISSEVFLADPASRVDASSTLGINGMVDIRAPVTSLGGTLAPLPQAFVNVAALLPARCAARLSEGKASSLVLSGRDGLPIAPDGLLPSPLVLDDRLAADPAGAGVARRPQSSRFALLTSDDKVFPRMRVWNANRLLQTAPDLGCSKLLRERKADFKNSQ